MIKSLQEIWVSKNYTTTTMTVTQLLSIIHTFTCVHMTCIIHVFNPVKNMYDLSSLLNLTSLIISVDICCAHVTYAVICILQIVIV